MIIFKFVNNIFLDIINRTYVEEQSALQRKILNYYNKKTKPVRNQSLPITVKAHIYVMHFSIDEAQQTLTLNGHVYLVKHCCNIKFKTLVNL